MKKQVKVKALLDAGSQRTYISERILKFPNLSTEVVDDVNICTFGNSAALSKSVDRLLLVAQTGSFENILTKAFCLPMLCLLISSPSIAFLKKQFENFHGIEFVDKESEKEIDLLIGSDLYWSFVARNIVNPGELGLVAVETKFGWILCGCVGMGGKTQSVNFVSSATSAVQIGLENDELDNQ